MQAAPVTSTVVVRVASVVKEFDSLQNWNGGGALGGYTPSSHGVYNCDVDVQIKGNDFVRKAPASGLFCGGQTWKRIS